MLENRRRVAQSLGVAPEHLLTLHQVHSADVVHVREPGDARGVRADAMVTTVPGLALAALSADCAPVLLADGEAGVIGAAHAGWGGAFRGVLEATVEAMTGLGARRTAIRAVVGDDRDDEAQTLAVSGRRAALTNAAAVLAAAVAFPAIAD